MSCEKLSMLMPTSPGSDTTVATEDTPSPTLCGESGRATAAARSANGTDVVNLQKALEYSTMRLATMHSQTSATYTLGSECRDRTDRAEAIAIEIDAQIHMFLVYLVGKHLTSPDAQMMIECMRAQDADAEAFAGAFDSAGKRAEDRAWPVLGALADPLEATVEALMCTMTGFHRYMDALVATVVAQRVHANQAGERIDLCERTMHTIWMRLLVVNAVIYATELTTGMHTYDRLLQVATRLGVPVSEAQDRECTCDAVPEVGYAFPDGIWFNMCTDGTAFGASARSAYGEALEEATAMRRPYLDAVPMTCVNAWPIVVATDTDVIGESHGTDCCVNTAYRKVKELRSLLESQTSQSQIAGVEDLLACVDSKMDVCARLVNRAWMRLRLLEMIVACQLSSHTHQLYQQCMTQIATQAGMRAYDTQQAWNPYPFSAFPRTCVAPMTDGTPLGN
jgi:hypothetical protein